MRMQLLLALLLLRGASAVPCQEVGSRAEPGVLGNSARLNIRGVPLQTALQLLSIRSGVSLAYSPDLLSGHGTVSCACASLTVGEALRALLAGTKLGYEANARRIIIAPQSDLHASARSISDQGRAQEPGILTGAVRSIDDGAPIRGARVAVSGKPGELRTGSNGSFRASLAAGLYSLNIRALGYAPRELTDVVIVAGDTTSVSVALSRAPLELRAVVVTPSTYGVIGEGEVFTPHTLSREDVQTRPNLGEDIYRTLNRLPGVTSDDISAKIHVRGGPNDQVLELFDGLELIEPFHLKDIDGVVSIIDVESISDVNLMTGGFPAEYGDKMTGVIKMQSVYPRADRVRTTLGLSFMNATIKSEGGFARGRGRWLATARRGYLDLVLAITDATADGVEVSPRYYDLHGKLQYQLGSRHLIAGNFLHAGDNLSLVEEDATELESAWSSSYGWLNWHADFSRSLTAETILSIGRLTRNRAGADFDNDTTQTLAVDDHSSFDFYGLKQNWDLLVADRWQFKWGFDLRDGRASYDYSRWWTRWEPNRSNPFEPQWTLSFDTTTVIVDTTGYAAGFYVSNRLRPIDPLTLELGARYDYHSHTGQGAVSPRVNAALQIGGRTTLRGAWGYYYQSHGLHELQASDGDSLFYPAQRGEHRVLGLEYRPMRDLAVRVEGYYRGITDPRPEYRSLEPTYEPVWEEGPEDRVRIAPNRGRAMGIEFFAQKTAGRFVWSANYTLAAVQDELDQEWVPRPYDQRHTVRLEFGYRPNSGWSLAWAWQYHSPWPATAQVYQPDTVAVGWVYFARGFGPLHGERLPAYHRFDVRISRRFQFARSKLSVYLDVFNLYDRENPKAYDYWLEGSPPHYSVHRDIHALIGVLPTIGVRWEF